MTLMTETAQWATDEHRMFAEMAGKFYDAEMVPHIERWIEQGVEFESLLDIFEPVSHPVRNLEDIRPKALNLYQIAAVGSDESAKLHLAILNLAVPGPESVLPQEFGTYFESFVSFQNLF